MIALTPAYKHGVSNKSVSLFCERFTTYGYRLYPLAWYETHANDSFAPYSLILHVLIDGIIKLISSLLGYVQEIYHNGKALQN